MDVTTQRRCLAAISGVLLVGTAGSLAWSLSAVEPSDGQPVSTRPRPPAVISPEIRSQDHPFTAQSLRGPLYDPPPVKRAEPPPRPPVPSPSPQPTLEVTLVGTIIEADQSLAIVADASGKFDVKGVGQPLELSPPGIMLKQIESERVTLEYQGRQSTVQLDRQVKKKRKRDR